MASLLSWLGSAASGVEHALGIGQKPNQPQQSQPSFINQVGNAAQNVAQAVSNPTQFAANQVAQRVTAPAIRALPQISNQVANFSNRELFPVVAAVPQAAYRFGSDPKLQQLQRTNPSAAIGKFVGSIGQTGFQNSPLAPAYNLVGSSFAQASGKPSLPTLVGPAQSYSEQTRTQGLPRTLITNGLNVLGTLGAGAAFNEGAPAIATGTTDKLANFATEAAHNISPAVAAGHQLLSSETGAIGKNVTGAGKPYEFTHKTDQQLLDGGMSPEHLDFAKRNYLAAKEAYLNNPKMAVRDAQGNLQHITINTDKFRPATEPLGYKGTNAADTHEVASAFANELYHTSLPEMRGKGNNTVLTLAGGGGSGKGTALEKFKADPAYDVTKYPLVLDQVAGDHAKLMAKAAQAQDHGYDFRHIFVQRDPELAAQGIADRAQRLLDNGQTPRTVPLVEQGLKDNLAATEVAKRVAQERLIPTAMIKNNGGVNDMTLHPNPQDIVDHINKLVYNKDELKGRITNATEQKFQNGQLHPSLREGLLPAGNEADAASAKAPIASKEPQVRQTAPQNQVALRPLDVQIGKNDRATAQNLRDAYSGYKNQLIVKGTQLADQVKKLAPKEQKAVFWYNEAGGNLDTLKSWATDGEPKTKPYVQDIQAALNLSPGAKKAAIALQEGYKQLGQSGLESGALKTIRNEYGNSRLYTQTPGKDFVSTELNKGLSTYTSHSKARVYNTMHEAILNGKVPATTNAADLFSVHNEELSQAIASKQLVNQMSDSGLGKLVTDAKDIPNGWKQINVKGIGFSQKFVAPEHIASGLKALTDPNFLNNYNLIKNVRKFQGVVKTVDLSYSMFHHLTMVTQMLGQTVNHPLNTVNIIRDVMGGKDINPLEQDFVAHGGITSKLGDNQDVLHTLASGPSRLDKLAQVPGLKQAVDLNAKNGEFLFGKVQRYLKTMDYTQKASNWVADHPNATNEAVVSAKRGFAKEVNNAYGGLNWESMGVDKTQQAAMRLAFLAPDWLTSNFSLGKQALTDIKGTGGAAARRNIATTVVGGMLATEAINHVLTGHFTNQNEKGHEFEVQVQPGVYVSLMRGGIGDLIKMGSMMVENGPTTGAGRYFQGKLSPFARTGVGLLTGRNYYGQAITKKGDSLPQDVLNEGKFIASSAAPLPFSATSVPAYLKSGQPVNPITAGLVATGLARYSAVPKSSPNSPTPKAATATSLPGDKIMNSTDKNATSKSAQNVRSVYGDVTLTKPIQESANRVASADKHLTDTTSPQDKAALERYARLTDAGKKIFMSDPTNAKSLALAQYDTGQRKTPNVATPKVAKAQGVKVAKARKVAVAKMPKIPKLTALKTPHLKAPKVASFKAPKMAKVKTVKFPTIKKTRVV